MEAYKKQYTADIYEDENDGIEVIIFLDRKPVNAVGGLENGDIDVYEVMKYVAEGWTSKPFKPEEWNGRTLDEIAEEANKGYQIYNSMQLIAFLEKGCNAWGFIWTNMSDASLKFFEDFQDSPEEYAFCLRQLVPNRWYIEAMSDVESLCEWACMCDELEEADKDDPDEVIELAEKAAEKLGVEIYLRF